MKKKISLILAFLMAASMLAGCKKTNEDSAGIPDTSTMPSLTQMTTTTAEPETTTTTAKETEDTEETTSETEETTQSESETTTAPEETTTAATASAAVQTTASKAWNETEISETLYIKTECYSRTQAIVGSESVKKYTVGTKINIVAATDTGYYKLADGTFIHSDYVTEDEPKTQTTTAPDSTTKKETTTTKKETDNNPSSKPISSAYNKSYTERYPYKQLSKSEQQLYANIVKAAENFETNVQVPDGLMSDDVFKIYLLVFNNEPQLFWLSTTVPSGYGTIKLQYELTRSQAENAQKTIDSTVNDIMKKVNGYTSTISKLKVIHDWIVTHNTAKVDSTFANCGIYNSLTGVGVLQCQGYAKTAQYLCDIAGIECMTVVGNNPHGSTHAWNVVYCDNGYYIFDTTWDDPIIDYGKSDYVRYLYFLANDDMTRDTHLNVSTATRSNGKRIKLYDPPACTQTACYYFKAYNKEYSDLDSAEEALYAEFDEAIAAGKQVVHIRVTSHKLWDTLIGNDYAKKFQNYARSKSSKVDRLNRQKTFAEDVLVVEYDIVYK